MGDLYQVWWRGVQVGEFEVIAIDMWYQDGNWLSNASAEARQFETLILTFNASDTMKNPSKGTRIILRPLDSPSEINALVIAFDRNILMIRLILDEKAVQWLINNVY